MTNKDFFDKVYHITESEININPILTELSAEYSDELILSTENEDGYDALLIVFQCLIEQKLARDLSEPLDFTFLKFLLDKKADPNKAYSVSTLYDLFSTRVFSDFDRLEEESSLLDIAKHMAFDKGFKAMEEHVKADMTTPYVGFMELYETIKKYANGEEGKLPLITFSEDTLAEIIYGKRIDFGECSYSEVLNILHQIELDEQLSYAIIDIDMSSMSYAKDDMLPFFSIIIGQVFKINDSYNCPSSIELNSLREFIKNTAKIEKVATHKIIHNLNRKPSGNFDLFLVSGGPLSHAAIMEGELVDYNEKNDSSVFFRDQDQECQTEGINGSFLFEARYNESINISALIERMENNIYLCSGYD